MVLAKGLRLPSGLVFLLFWTFFFLYLFLSLHRPNQLVWDENIYINTANVILTSAKPYPTPEHPAFGREVLALGIKVFGNNVVGWRFFSVFFGSLTMALVCHLTYFLTKRWGVAVFLGALLLLDPFLLVHFRLGMLESTLAAMLVLATYCSIRFFQAPQLRWAWFLGAALASGLALCTKLLGLVFIPVLLALMVLRIWREPRSWLKMVGAALVFFSIILAVFFSCYGFLGYSPMETVGEIQFMLGFHSVFQGPTPFMSKWYEWLYLRHPIWYHFRSLEGGMVEGMVATGNFVLWIAAEISLLYMLVRKFRSPVIWTLALLVIGQFVLYSQKYTTFIHYMTEILPFLYAFLGLAIGDLWDRFGRNNARILQIDFAALALVAALIYWKNVPYVWSYPVSQQEYFLYQGKEPPRSAPVNTSTAESNIP